jgi:hypothetical protein
MLAPFQVNNSAARRSGHLNSQENTDTMLDRPDIHRRRKCRCAAIG